MSYIIVWKSTHRSPFVSTDMQDFIESFSTEQEAIEYAEEVQSQNEDEGRTILL